MRRAASLISMMTVLGLLAGCLPLDADDDGERDDAYLDAIPAQDDLLVRIGSSDAEPVETAGILDPYAVDGCAECCIETVDGEEWYVDGDIYRLTRAAKWHINGGLVVAMGWIGAVVQYPASETSGDRFIWGPWRESLARIELRFVMEARDDGGYGYRLEGKNINAAADAWQAVAHGTLIPAGTPGAVQGDLTVDYSVIHLIDTAHPTPDSGRIVYTFDVTGYPYQVDARFEDFVADNGQVLNAVYRYRRLNEAMAGTLEFSVEADMWPEEALDGLPEQIAIDSEWSDTGEGRGQAMVQGGTLDTAESTVSKVVFNECWAGAAGLFYTTHQAATVTYSDGTAPYTELGCGDPSHCDK